MRITKRWETTEGYVRAGPLCRKTINEIAPTYPSTIQMEKQSLHPSYLTQIASIYLLTTEYSACRLSSLNFFRLTQETENVGWIHTDYKIPNYWYWVTKPLLFMRFFWDIEWGSTFINLGGIRRLEFHVWLRHSQIRRAYHFPGPCCLLWDGRDGSDNLRTPFNLKLMNCPVFSKQTNTGSS